MQNDEASQWKERQQAELALLQAMFPDQVTWNDQRQEVQYKSTAGASLTLRLPEGYPGKQEPTLLGAFDQQKKDIRQLTKDTFNSLNLPLDQEVLDTLLQRFEDVVESRARTLESTQSSKVLADSATTNEESCKTVVVWLHHLLNTNKRKLALHPSIGAAKIVGLTKPGYPGVLIYSGPREHVDAHVAELKDQRWQAFQVRMDVAGPTSWSFSHGSGIREVESMSDVTQAIVEKENRDAFLEAIHIKHDVKLARSLNVALKLSRSCINTSPYQSHQRSRCINTALGPRRAGKYDPTTWPQLAENVSKRAISTTSELHERADAASDEEVTAPISPLAIVFTDIVKSTAIWEKDSAVMAEAMEIHDNFVRRLLDNHAGYEVKQNGDGFMIAFQSALSALNFCLEVQVQLQEQEWPPHLLELGPAQPVVVHDTEHEAKDQKVLWKGLRLRMSAHFGEPVCKWNDIIKRMDYLGPAVNRAARYVSVCEGGQIVVSEEFIEALKSERTASLGENGPLYNDSQSEDTNGYALEQKDFEGLIETEFELRMLGHRHFKGVDEKQRLFFIIPKSLEGRLEYFPKHTYVQAEKGNLV
ncbi:hypothetical protein LTR64_001721 [Lithohypha guttulata]|nr:hypothetical protein LTR51_003915 [Lithohypha guttulata]